MGGYIPPMMDSADVLALELEALRRESRFQRASAPPKRGRPFRTRQQEITDAIQDGIMHGRNPDDIAAEVLDTLEGRRK